MPTVKRTNDEWRELLALQRRSGQTQAEWCAENGVNLYTLRDRSSRLKRLDNDTQSQAQLPVKTAVPDWIEIKPDGRIIRGSAPRIRRRFSPGFLINIW